MRMRPFLSFYGAKWRSAGWYAAPAHDVVVEPFAGSAGYSVYHGVRRAVLVELDPVIAAVWRYLIAVDPAELLRLPDVGPDQVIADLPVAEEARWLIGFWLGRGITHPARRPAKWNADILRGTKWQDSRSATWGAELRARLARQVEHVREWQIIEGSYEQAPDIEATWFVDPPYSGAGRKYRCHDLDRVPLADWCRARRGQVIVCEGPHAKWLPFRHLGVARGSRGYAAERVWCSP